MAKNKGKMSVGAKILLAICLIVFCGSGYFLADYFLKAHQAQSGFEKLKKVEDGSGGRDLTDLYRQNKDLIGWVSIDGTKIDYPVMQTKDEGQDPEYYLHRNFEKEYSDAGTPFMDAASDIYIPTSNWLIYGHHMRSGIMFHDLVKYEDEDFYEEHPVFRFDSITGTGSGEYQIIAAGYSKVYPKGSKAFKYYQYGGITTEEDFNDYLAGVKKLSLYDTGETAVYSDQLVTLSTCAYQTDNGRFFVVGKLVR